MKDFLLETFPNPDRKDCPDEKSIQAIAEGRSHITEAVGLHIGSCSECYAEYRNFRQDWEEGLGERPVFLRHGAAGRIAASRPQTRPRFVTVGIAASLVVACSGGYVLYRTSHHTQSDASSASSSGSVPVIARVDLFESGTLRGADDDALTPLNKVILPAAIVNLSVVLPRFSDEGTYRLNVSTDKQGKNVVASGTGKTDGAGLGKVMLAVTLDLRNAKAGSYFLATVRGTDNGTYYYPLQIK
jgi:hypothetical protein